MKARVFIARGGNRCITPMYAGIDEESASINHGTPAGMFAIMAGIEDTREYIDVEDGQEMRNIPVRLASQGFAHGALDLICEPPPAESDPDFRAAE